MNNPDNNVVDFDNFRTIYTTTDREISVLSGVLSKNHSILEFVETFRSEWFLSNEHQSICEAIKELFLAKEEVNPLTVSKVLHGMVTESYIIRLANNYVPSGALKNYKKLLKDAYINRQINEALEVSQNISTESDPEVALGELKRFINEIGMEVSDEDKTSNEEAKSVAINELKERASGGMRGVPTGLDTLDKLVDGLSPTEFVVVAARPGMGKSALASTIASNVTFRASQPVLYYTLEMNKTDLIKRIVTGEAKSNTNFEKMERVEIPENYRILYKPSLTLDQLRISMMKELAHLDTQPAVVVIDHIGLIRVPNARSSYESMKFITHELKAMAGEFNTCVMGLCQLNRSVEQRENKQPQMSDLRDSGSIEEDADEVWLLYRPDYYASPSDHKNNQAFVCVGKDRDGQGGVAQLIFNPNITLFS